MKKEIFAILLLLGILILSLLSTHIINDLTDRMIQKIETALIEIENDNWSKAEAAALEAITVWRSRAEYAHILLRHADADSAVDSVYVLLAHIYAKHDGEARASAEHALHRIEDIRAVESLRIGNIF